MFGNYNPFVRVTFSAPTIAQAIEGVCCKAIIFLHQHPGAIEHPSESENEDESDSQNENDE